MTSKKRGRPATKALTAGNLTKTLWNTLQGVQNGKVEPQVANSIAGQSREICRVVKLQMELNKVEGGNQGLLE